ncbi:MAG: TSUP family transporter, partial [Caulobacteraceae bacterium]
MHLSPEVFVTLVAVAGLAGFVDAIAGGGGLLCVPALLAAGLPPVAVLATNKLQSTFGTATACFNFARKGHVDFRSMALPVAGAFLGSALGAVIVQRLDPSFLAGLVPILLIATAAYFLLSPKMSEVDRHQWMKPAAYTAIAFAIGFYDGFFGPGAGSFYTVSLIALMGMGLIRATAHTKLLNVTSNLAALITLAAGGHVIWTLGFCMAAA